MWEDEKPSKRTLGIRDKPILSERAIYKCEACGKILDFVEMQVGHKIAYSKGGNATLKNSVCLCYKCNNLQDTDSWNTFLKKMGKKPESEGYNIREMLKKMTLSELKIISQRHKVSVKGTIEEGFFGDKQISPSKTQYVNALSKKISEEDITLPCFLVSQLVPDFLHKNMLIFILDSKAEEERIYGEILEALRNGR